MHGETRRDVRAFVGARIRELRERRGMGVRTLSELSAIPEFMVRTLEGGRMQMRFDNLLCLARALDVCVTAFFDEDDTRGSASALSRNRKSEDGGMKKEDGDAARQG